MVGMVATISLPVGSSTHSNLKKPFKNVKENHTMTISQTIAARAKPRPLNVFLEKSSVSSTGRRAKVLFRTNRRNGKNDELRNHSVVEQAFSAVLGDSARIIPASLVAANDEGSLFYGVVSLNRKTMSIDDANAENSGMTLVSANMFADASDDIWTVDGENNVLVRTENDDLASILKTRMSGTLSTAAAGMEISSPVQAGTVVKFVSSDNSVTNGIMVDTSTVCDGLNQKFQTITPEDIVASCEASVQISNGINKAVGDEVSTFAELSAGQRSSLRDYIRMLYKQNPAVMQTYLGLINKFATV